MAPLAENDELSGDAQPRRARRFGRPAVVALAVLLALVIAGLALLWGNRVAIADNVIASELEKRGIAASYEIERIGGRRQVLRNVAVGDPARPDLTIERAEVVLGYRFGLPRIDRITLVRPRLFGTYRRGELSFGALDPILFTGEEGPFELPDLDLTLVDGRGRIDSDYGPLAFKLAGEGALRDGFTAELAALAPRVSVSGCQAARVTLYGELSIAAREPRFAGPLRFGPVRCPERGLALAGGALQIDGGADEALERFEGQASLRAGAARWGGVQLAGLNGTSQFTWRDGGLTAAYDLSALRPLTSQVSAARLDGQGTIRARRLFERIELDARIDGRDIRPGAGLDAMLGQAARASAGTLLGPLLGQARTALTQQSRGSALSATATVRQTGGRTIMVVEEARLRGRSGPTLLSLSRFQYTTGGGAAARYAGHFALAGENLPQVAGRLEQRPGGALRVNLAMAEYRAGASRLAIPELEAIVAPGGALSFAGDLRASGVLPGGFAENLVVPVDGRRMADGTIAVWNECTPIGFERLQLANLELARHELTLCPPRGSSILRLDGRGLRIAAGAPALQLAGRLGETPIALSTGAVGLAWPGALSARGIEVTLGPPATATRFAVADLSADLGQDIAGRFSQADVRLYAVPLDLLGASGSWRYDAGRLEITDGAFTLEDRSVNDRFLPLTAAGATLALEDNRIRAEAPLREPDTGRLVSHVSLEHDLARGAGWADLAVPGLLFDGELQPVDLTLRAAGVVALVRGTVTGSGRIDWNEAGVTSSGRFATEALDFAAPFGPVRGASGTLVFTDLLRLTTAPEQRLRVASINPGIEVLDGEVAIQIRGGQVLALQGGKWPFMGGILTLRPIDITFAAEGEEGVGEVRRYVLEMEGLDAARFVDRMELNNLAATGIFDGTVPIVFDETGFGRLEGGLLLSRPPGGNVAYVGELTYENLGTMANFAFSTLRSLDYRQMRIGIDGPLAGQIITRVRLDGVSQGAGAARNFATRAIAGLPIRLDVNVSAPFQQLLSSTRALYDPAAILDPRSAEVGLLDAQGNAIPPGSQPAPDPGLPAGVPDRAATDTLIQRRESEEMP
jgi:hypothetical protein